LRGGAVGTLLLSMACIGIGPLVMGMVACERGGGVGGDVEVRVFVLTHARAG
jgi:hypothetical protein